MNKTSICSQCYRLNSPDARFCDWCGAKPERKLDTCACTRCGSSNHPYAKYCITCGSLITAPQQSTSQFVAPTWLAGLDSNNFQNLNKKYETVSTQTYGIFCPRNTETKKDDKNEKLAVEKKPLLTAISAGRGYWRQQMDHICAHLKAYAQNNAEFRALVGEPRLGKINIAKVDVDSSWLTITASFPIRNNANKDNFMFNSQIDNNLSLNSRLNNIDYHILAAGGLADDQRSSSSGFTSDSDSLDSKPNVTKKAMPKKKSQQDESSKLTGEDRQLIKELSRSGHGRVEEIRQLLNEGANPNAVTKDGLSIIHLAIRNKHLDCLSVLLNTNVNLQAKAPPRGNTALHEAVLLGAECEKYLKILLE